MNYNRTSFEVRSRPRLKSYRNLTVLGRPRPRPSSPRPRTSYKILKTVVLGRPRPRPGPRPGRPRPPAS